MCAWVQKHRVKRVWKRQLRPVLFSRSCFQPLNPQSTARDDRHVQQVLEPVTVPVAPKETGKRLLADAVTHAAQPRERLHQLPRACAPTGHADVTDRRQARYLAPASLTILRRRPTVSERCRCW